MWFFWDVGGDGVVVYEFDFGVEFGVGYVVNVF